MAILMRNHTIHLKTEDKWGIWVSFFTTVFALTLDNKNVEMIEQIQLRA